MTGGGDAVEGSCGELGREGKYCCSCEQEMANGSRTYSICFALKMDFLPPDAYDDLK